MTSVLARVQQSDPQNEDDEIRGGGKLGGRTLHLRVNIFMQKKTEDCTRSASLKNFWRGNKFMRWVGGWGRASLKGHKNIFGVGWWAGVGSGQRDPLDPLKEPQF